LQVGEGVSFGFGFGFSFGMVFFFFSLRWCYLSPTDRPWWLSVIKPIVWFKHIFCLFVWIFIVVPSHL
jgi:hypothetical protein